MEIRSWALAVRILNLLSAAGLFGLQIWYLIELLIGSSLGRIITNMFAPMFLWY